MEALEMSENHPIQFHFGAIRQPAGLVIAVAQRVEAHVQVVTGLAWHHCLAAFTTLAEQRAWAIHPVWDWGINQISFADQFHAASFT